MKLILIIINWYTKHLMKCPKKKVSKWLNYDDLFVRWQHSRAGAGLRRASTLKIKSTKFVRFCGRAFTVIKCRGNTNLIGGICDVSNSAKYSVDNQKDKHSYVDKCLSTKQIYGAVVRRANKLNLLKTVGVETNKNNYY